MSKFMIQCAICAVKFTKEDDYENHECMSETVTEVKLETPELQEETKEEEEKSIDSSVKRFQARMKHFVNIKQKKPRGRKRKVPQIDSDEEEEELQIETYTDQPIKKEVVEEPIDICEVVNIKDEPMDEEEITDMQDPLANMGDILGLEDEDYLIENFVEYDDEASDSLEIDESSEEANSMQSIMENVNAAALALSHPKKVNPNVGKRIEHTDNKGYECDVCKKRYYLKSKLEEHLKTSHKSPRPYGCNICGKRFTHKNYVNLHMRVHTGEKPYQCTLCDRSYSHKTSFTIHMRIHKGERPYECSVCGKKCYDKSGLTSHMRSHTKETPYQCECCGRKFTHSKSLLVHRRNHTGEKPYVCPHCGRAFRHWHKHKIHIRLHTGERPYKCKICNKGFPRNDEVKRHMKSHIGIKSFRCSICGVYCATQASITGHINLHHVNLATDRKFLPEKTIVENSQSGILGKKVEYQPSEHRVFDTTSYEQFLDRPCSSISDTPIKTLVTSRPMTSAEKVTNKSMTYRQFLNDQEQQLLAKGLKVVSKNGNTYGLEKVSNSENDEENPKKSEKNSKISLDNVFVKVNNVKKQSAATPRPTRIILPNIAKSKNPVVLGEEPSKLLMQSVDQKPDINSGDTKSDHSVLIQTVGNNMDISAPMVVTSNQQTSSTDSKASQQNKSLLLAALTNNKQSNPSENIIVLNKGVSGNANPPNPVAPLVVLSPQPTQQTQQLLLLPGINGGPARLVILQASQPVIKLENPTAAVSDPNGSLDVKKENPVPMVQLHTTVNPTSQVTQETSGDVIMTAKVKEEPKDEEMDTSIEAILPDSIKKEIEEFETDLQTKIKTEPIE